MIVLMFGVYMFKLGLVIVFFFGIELVLVDNDGNELQGVCEGNLVIKCSWFSQICSVYGDYQCMIDIYFLIYLDIYFIGDGVWRDEDGYYWIIG